MMASFIDQPASLINKQKFYKSSKMNTEVKNFFSELKNYTHIYS